VVRRDKDDSCLFEGAFERAHHGCDRLVLTGFEASDCPQTDAASLGEVGLRDAEQASGGLRLSGGDCHRFL